MLLWNTVLQTTDVLHKTCAGTTCDQPYVPVNGEFICSEEEEGINCTLHCKDGFSFTQDAVHSYFCAYNGVWEPPYSPDRPDCSGKNSIGIPVTHHIFGAHIFCFHWVLANNEHIVLFSFPVNRVANNGFKPFEMLFKASRCDDVDLVKSFTGQLNSKLEGMVRISG